MIRSRPETDSSSQGATNGAYGEGRDFSTINRRAEDGVDALPAEWEGFPAMVNRGALVIDDDFGEGAFLELANWLGTSPREVTTLEISMPSLGSEVGASLGMALRTNRHIKRLTLRDSALGDDRIGGFSEMMRVNGSITSLYTQGSALGETGARILFEALRENATLEILYLDERSMGRGAIEPLAQMLKENRSIAGLFIRNSVIDEAGAARLGEMLVESPTLKSFTTLDCDISRAGVESLRCGARASASLTDISFLSLGFELETDDVLDGVLRRNAKAAQQASDAIAVANEGGETEVREF